MVQGLQLTSDLIEKLERLALVTTQGSFVRLEDVRRLIQEQAANETVEEMIPEPKNIHQARRMAAEYLDGQDFGPKDPLEPGRAVPATEPQSSSRT